MGVKFSYSSFWELYISANKLWNHEFWFHNQFSVFHLVYRAFSYPLPPFCIQGCSSSPLFRKVRLRIDYLKAIFLFILSSNIYKQQIIYIIYISFYKIITITNTVTIFYLLCHQVKIPSIISSIIVTLTILATCSWK